MAYVVPQVLVFQEFNQNPQNEVKHLPAHISGGHADLIRFDETNEKERGNLGFYDRLVDTNFLWPNRPAGAIVDQEFTKLFMEDALLLYFTDVIGSGDTISTVAGESNQVRAAATSFKSNGVAFPRDAQFIDRDVKLGDTVKVRAVVGSSVFTLCTYVAGFVAEVIASVIAAAESDEDNTLLTVASSGSTKTGGADNCVDITATDESLYDGLEDGDVTETYTVLVIESSAGEDATTGKLRVTSASGNDDVAEVTPSAFGVPTAIGSRGLTATFTNTTEALCSISAEGEGVAVADLIVGQEWEVTVSQAFTPPIPTSGGDYTGDEDLVYIIEVTKGGLYADEPEITVTTDKGTDASGPTKITAAATAVAVGTKGVTVEFDETALNKGDRYFIDAQAESEGAIQTLRLGHNFDQDVIDNGATEVDLKLYIRKAFIEIDENREGFAPLVNWEQSETELTVKSGIVAFDESWTDGGVPVALEVHSDCNLGTLFVELRFWLADLCGVVNTIFDVATLDDDISGPLHPDNELKWGVFKALQNSNGVIVSYTAVCEPSQVEAWLEVIELIDGKDQVYGLVPLTHIKAVWSAFQAHIGSQSSPEFGLWRVLWLNGEDKSEKVIAYEGNSEDGEVILATLQDDPNTSGTQFTLLQVPASNANFVENGVRPGDIVRYLFTTDGFDNTTFTEFIVDIVINEDTIRLKTGHTVAVNTPQKVQVFRNLTATEHAAELALTDGFSDRRVRWVWPDVVGQDGFTVQGYFACAVLAGLSSGVVPQQGLTNLEMAGIDDVSRTTGVFNRTQLNTMAEGGVWIITQDPESGIVFTRHAVTTGDTDDLNQREEMITRNLDSISFFFKDVYEPFIGVANVVAGTLALLRSETNAGLRFLEGNAFVDRLGGQLVTGSISELRPHFTLKDRIVIVLALDLPEALNNIEAHLVV